MPVKHLIIPVLLLFAAAEISHAQTDHPYAPAAKDPSKKTTVIGRMQVHTVTTGETLLDIARAYGLGFSELKAFHPDKDPWLLEEDLSRYVQPAAFARLNIVERILLTGRLEGRRRGGIKCRLRRDAGDLGISHAFRDEQGDDCQSGNQVVRSQVR